MPLWLFHRADKAVLGNLAGQQILVDGRLDAGTRPSVGHMALALPGQQHRVVKRSGEGLSPGVERRRIVPHPDHHDRSRPLRNVPPRVLLRVMPQPGADVSVLRVNALCAENRRFPLETLAVLRIFGLRVKHIVRAVDRYKGLGAVAGGSWAGVRP